MSISIRTDSLPAPDKAVALFLSVKWGEMGDYNLPDWEKALKNNSLVVTAWDGANLIGMARVLSDNVNDTYITDVVVSPSHQKNNIGRQMVSKILDTYPHTAIYVCGLSTAEGFFEKCGLKKKSQLSSLSIAPVR